MLFLIKKVNELLNFKNLKTLIAISLNKYLKVFYTHVMIVCYRFDMLYLT